MKHGKILAAGALAALVMAGCGQESEDSDSMPPPPDNLWENSLNGCSECHAEGRDQEEGPDMSSPTAFLDGMKNKTANEDYPLWAATKAGDCNDVKLIDPGNADNSLLVASLVQSYSEELSIAKDCVTGYNSHASILGIVLDENDETKPLINELTTWINQGE